LTDRSKLHEESAGMELELEFANEVSRANKETQEIAVALWECAKWLELTPTYMPT